MPASCADPAPLPAWLWPRAAYVHVPFCAHHCGYCDFAVVAGRDHLTERYIEAITCELATLGSPQSVRSIFLGGGTPTHLDAGPLGRLLGAITAWLPLQPDGEFSVEANPDSLTADKVRVLAQHGVNRVSLGAQSFQPAVLGVLERRHDPAELPGAVARAREHIANVSLDLIFGVPGQTEALWADDLDRALALRPDHVSTYGLTYEKGTRLWQQRRRGALRPLDEEAELRLYQLGIDTLEAAGFEQYEISNFSRPGRRSAHNQVYWANEAYFGFGLGAARYVGGRREVNTRDLTAYLRRTLSGQSPVQQGEQLDPHESARETMAVQLRRCDGIDRAAFRVRTGVDLDAVSGPALEQLAGLGLLDDDGHRVRLTRRGRPVADAVIERLLRCG